MSPKSDSPIKAERVQSMVKRLRGWEFVAGKKEADNVIRRTYVFPSFPAAVRFVDYVAEVAEQADHHPDIDIRYNQVILSLSTHSAGGITDKDFDLARTIDVR